MLVGGQDDIWSTGWPGDKMISGLVRVRCGQMSPDDRGTGVSPALDAGMQEVGTLPRCATALRAAAIAAQPLCRSGLCVAAAGSAGGAGGNLVIAHGRLSLRLQN